MTPRRTSSILEVLHPDGVVDGVLTLGAGLPATLDPGLGTPSASRPVGLAILAPTSRECRGAWLAGAVAAIARRLAEDGIAYALVPPRRRAHVRRVFADAGLEPALELVHLPNVATSRHLVPLERAPLDYLVASLTSWRRWERSAGELVGRLPTSLTRVLAPVGLVVRRPGSRPLYEWLRTLAADEGEIGSVVVSRSWHGGHGGIVLQCFERGARAPWSVAKLRDGPTGSDVTLGEADNLMALGAPATAAGAAVPRRIAVGRAGSRAVLLEGALPGEVAATVLHGRPGRLEAVLERVAEWLARWHELTAEASTLTGSELERELLGPAAAVAPRVPDGDRYVAWIGERCAEAEGTVMPRVAVHNDLTMWNVLVDGAELGVVDWEGAGPAGWPLGDFLYAAVDAVAATGAYRDRLAAFEQCFSPGAPHEATVARLHARLVEALGVTREQVTLCFHACWLRQALDGRRTDPADREPFDRIVAALVQSSVGAGAPGVV